VWFILEFYVTQILISTTSRFECISRLIKVTLKHSIIILIQKLLFLVSFYLWLKNFVVVFEEFNGGVSGLIR
jgi:hypothetical protein